MKKSAIYLGASAAILAIAGAFTTKNSTNVKTVAGYTIGCINSVDVLCGNTSAKTCKTSGGTTLYTKQGSTCENKLHTGTE